MNNIEKLYNGAAYFKDFTTGYFNYLNGLLHSLDINAIEAFVEELEDARITDQTIFIAGNGGSAATASHMANDLGTDVLRKGETDKPFRVFSLADNMSVFSAVANDVGYENVFIDQLRIHYRPGDKLVVISASGNSQNVVKAAQWVKNRSGKVTGIVGFDGGILKEICDVVIHVKTLKGEYGPVEDIHMILDHLISNWLISKLRDKEG